MSVFLFVPSEERGPDNLLSALGATERISVGGAAVVVNAFREAAAGPLSRYKSWSLWEVPPPDEDHLLMVSEAVAEQLRQEGTAVVDLEVKMVTLAELQAVAAGLNLSVGLVAVLKQKEGASPPLMDPLDNALLAAISELGGTAAMGQLCNRLDVPASKLRKHLAVLVQFRRVARVGRQGGARYRLLTGG